MDEIELPLSDVERKRKIAWAQTEGLCLDCYRQQRWPIGTSHGIQRPNIVDGRIWDGNVYGIDGRHYVYLDYERVNVDDDTARDLRQYAQAILQEA